MTDINETIRNHFMPRIVAWSNALPDARAWRNFDRDVAPDDFEIHYIVHGPMSWGLLFIACGPWVERLRVIVSEPDFPEPVMWVLDDDDGTHRVP